MHYVIGFFVGAFAGFGGGVWYYKSVREELKALRAKVVGNVKGAAGKL